MHTDMEWRPKARLGDLRGRKNKRERHNLLGVAPANQKYRLDDQHPRVFPNYCTNDLNIATFCDFQICYQEAVLETSDNVQGLGFPGRRAGGEYPPPLSLASRLESFVELNGSLGNESIE